MSQPLRVSFLEQAKEYISGLPEADQGAIAKDIENLSRNDVGGIYTKQLKGPIRELIVGHHRITYFKLENVLYFVRGFRKKSDKTPKVQIEYAHKIFTLFKSKS